MWQKERVKFRHFLDQSKPYGKSFSMKHIKEELENFLEFLKEIEEVTGQMPMVIESTGHYHSSVIQYLEEQEILYILLNSIISYQAKKSSLRKVKTDAIDAYQLCVLYSKVSLLMLKEYPTSEAVLKAGESKLEERVMEFCPSRSGHWAWGKAEKIMDSASRNKLKGIYGYRRGKCMAGLNLQFKPEPQARPASYVGARVKVPFPKRKP